MCSTTIPIYVSLTFSVAMMFHHIPLYISMKIRGEAVKPKSRMFVF